MSIDKKHFIKIPLPEILEELGVKATPENLMILKKLLENKMPLSKDRFTSLARLLGEIPYYQEEILDLLFNPFEITYFKHPGRGKTFLYLEQENQDKKVSSLLSSINIPKLRKF